MGGYASGQEVRVNMRIVYMRTQYPHSHFSTTILVCVKCWSSLSTASLVDLCSVFCRFTIFSNSFSTGSMLCERVKGGERAGWVVVVVVAQTKCKR